MTSAQPFQSRALRAFVEGLQVDRVSWQAGFASAGQAVAAICPAGLDMFSFYLGRAEARRYTKRSA